MFGSDNFRMHGDSRRYKEFSKEALRGTDQGERNGSTPETRSHRSLKRSYEAWNASNLNDKEMITLVVLWYVSLPETFNAVSRESVPPCTPPT